MIRKCNSLFLLRITRLIKKLRFKKFYKLKQSSKNKHRNNTKIHTLLYDKMDGVLSYDLQLVIVI